MTRKRAPVAGRTAAGEFPVPLFDVVANCITIRFLRRHREDMARPWPSPPKKDQADIELQPLSRSTKSSTG